MYKPVVLVVLDGFGISKTKIGNAIAQAKLPTIEKLEKYYPETTLQASGISVGLPWGEMGNSEVGHLTLGAGRTIYQNLPRITLAIRDKSFFQNEALLKAINHAKKNNSALHLLGLTSNGAVHSHLDHLYALIEMAKQNEIEKLYIHAITDGRDTSPTEGKSFIEKLQIQLSEIGIGKIATIAGRYFTMDRNNNWDRIQAAYDNMTADINITDTPIEKYIEDSYQKDVTDEFIKPAMFDRDGTIADNDAVIFFNFREDRARQITKAFVLPDFSKFPRKTIKNLQFTAMTLYEEALPIDVAFPPIQITNTLGEVLSKNGKKQLRITETEKYAHVTYFFNGGEEKPFPGEERVLIPSKPVESYAKLPEMSAEEITQKILDSLEQNKFDFILVNFANPDMVGHTGNVSATVKALEFTDSMLEKIIKKTLSMKGCLLITADHGNAEAMLDQGSGEKETEHSTNPVPIWFVSAENHRTKTKAEIEKSQTEVGGILSDIAPTVLEIMDISKPAEMTGTSLLSELE